MKPTKKNLKKSLIWANHSQMLYMEQKEKKTFHATFCIFSANSVTNIVELWKEKE